MSQMKELIVSLTAQKQDRSYPILVEEGLLTSCGEVIAAQLPARRAAIVTDSNVGPLYAATVEASLQKAGFAVKTVTIPAGEKSKSLETLTGLDQAALQALPEWQQSALSCARLAPSAVNRQPWRFQPEGTGIRIVKTSGNFGFGGVDLGIAMLHMELGAAHCSVSGQWQEMGDRPLFVPESENL